MDRIMNGWMYRIMDRQNYEWMDRIMNGWIQLWRERIYRIMDVSLSECARRDIRFITSSMKVRC